MEVVDPTIELGIATLDDIAGELVNREASAPGVIVWLPNDVRPRIPRVAMFGDVKPHHARYLGAVVLDAARYAMGGGDDCADRSASE